jgi:opacity protein-like surface antigen
MRLWLAGAAALWAVNASAVDVTLLVGYTVSAEFENVDTRTEVQVDESAQYAVAVDFPFEGSHQRLGFYLSQQNSVFSDDANLADSDLSITHLHFTAMTLWPRGRWEPFVLLGVGAAHYSPGDSTLKDVTRISGQIAAGTNFALTDHLLLRFGARWVPTFFNGSGAAFCDGGCTVGISSTVWSQGVVDAGIQFRF